MFACKSARDVMCAPSDGKSDEVLWFEKRELKERAARCAFFYLSLMRVKLYLLVLLKLLLLDHPTHSILMRVSTIFVFGCVVLILGFCFHDNDDFYLVLVFVHASVLAFG